MAEELPKIVLHETSCRLARSLYGLLVKECLPCIASGCLALEAAETVVGRGDGLCHSDHRAERAVNVTIIAPRCESLRRREGNRGLRGDGMKAPFLRGGWQLKIRTTVTGSNAPLWAPTGARGSTTLLGWAESGGRSGWGRRRISRHLHTVQHQHRGELASYLSGAIPAIRGI